MSAAVVRVGRGELAPLSFGVARLELLKWLAFAAMVFDHVAVFFPEVAPVWFREVGRFAFPVFALSFGLGLAASDDGEAVLRRLILPGAVAQLAWFAGGQWHGLNVLLAFAVVGALVLRAAKAEQLAFFMLVWLSLLSLPLSLLDGGFLTPLLVAAGFLSMRLRSWWPALVVGALASLFIGPVGALGAVAVVLCPGVRLPRVRAFAWLYASHVAVLAALGAAYA